MIIWAEVDVQCGREDVSAGGCFTASRALCAGMKETVEHKQLSSSLQDHVRYTNRDVCSSEITLV